jgi:uncharacterized iron-regulated protein
MRQILRLSHAAHGRCDTSARHSDGDRRGREGRTRCDLVAALPVRRIAHAMDPLHRRRFIARFVRLLCVGSAAAALFACATTTPPSAWESRLTGNAIVLLGEVHDNAEQHRLRLELLRRAFAAGWRPVIAMEQFDLERQADIERARRERPRDAQYLIEQAAPAARPGMGWNWAFYRPVVALALEYDLPLVAANLSAADTRRIVRGGLGSAFDTARLSALGLDRPRAADWQRAQEREIDLGHCGALPASQWARMADAQFARDAVMAELLRLRGNGRGIVLLAGNGHVRRDLGVPRWLEGSEAAPRVFAVGLLERGDTHPPAGAFDAVLRTEPAERPDPCEGFLRQRPPSAQQPPGPTPPSGG